MSFEEFYKSNYLKLYRIALSTVHDDEESRDLVAETFKRLWQVWDGTKEPSALAQTILRNKCISHIRHKNVKERFKQRIIADKEIAAGLDIAHERRIEMLRKEIETLGNEDRIIVQTVVFEKKGFKEVAAILNCSYATARRKFAALLLALKERIDKEENK